MLNALRAWKGRDWTMFIFVACVSLWLIWRGVGSVHGVVDVPGVRHRWMVMTRRINAQRVHRFGVWKMYIWAAEKLVEIYQNAQIPSSKLHFLQFIFILQGPRFLIIFMVTYSSLSPQTPSFQLEHPHSDASSAPR